MQMKKLEKLRERKELLESQKRERASVSMAHRNDTVGEYHS
jgi:hypothetical protein